MNLLIRRGCFSLRRTNDKGEFLIIEPTPPGSHRHPEDVWFREEGNLSSR